MYCSPKLLSTRELLSLDEKELKERIEKQLLLIKEKNEYYGAFVYVEEDIEIHGPALGVKDTIAVKGVPMTCCSKILHGHIPIYDATAYERLKDKTTFIGKTSCDSFACGSSGSTCDFHLTRNAYDPERVPGGSSGGSATALALGMVDFALGTDTFGSARAPASFSGIVGMRPSYGLVSRRGLVDLCMSMDTIAPMARDVYGVAYLLSLISGYDPGDLMTEKSKRKDYTEKIEEPLKKKKILLLKEGFSEPVDPRIAKLVEREARRIDAEFEEIDLDIDDVVRAYYILMPAEFASSMQRYDGFRYGLHVDSSNLTEWITSTRSKFLSEEVKRRILIGTAVTMKEFKEKYYTRAKKVILAFRQKIMKILRNDTFIICPTMPTLPWKIGEITDPIKEYTSDILTGIASAAGVPAISVPCGKIAGLPVGMQIIGKNDEVVLRLAREYEKERDKA